jgi:hypothetical protein
MMNDESGLEFFYYLAQMPLDQYDPRDIPMTEWKRELKEVSIDPIVRSVINYIIRHTDYLTPPTFHPITDLYLIYEEATSDRKFRSNLKSYSRQLHIILALPSAVEGRGNDKIYGIQCPLDDLKNKIRNILKDPEYPFVPSSLVRVPHSSLYNTH